MGKVVGKILGGGDAPKVIRQPIDDTKADQRQAAASRSALFETGGGVMGSELDAEQVGKRRTLLGN